MNFHKQLLAFTVILLSAQSFTMAAESILSYKSIALKVANVKMVPQERMKDIINVRDLFLKKAKYGRDCEELAQQGFTESGLYVIQPDAVSKAPILVVHCNMSYDCGAWTTLQRNTRQSEMTWNETWTTYKFGFGNVLGDHYFGNEYMHFITTQKWYKARIIVDEEVGTRVIQKYAEYDIFRIGNENTNYRLHLGQYKGSAGNAMSIIPNMVDNLSFSSRDRDTDADQAHNCAQKYGGGWWFNSCSDPNPYAMLTQKENIHWEPFCKNCRHVALLVKPVHMFCRPEERNLKMRY
ncbi:fibrinogen-like protein 1-like protein [Heptranchias perlo]|uniref:fibrinogen-like protein 1-like protein n=1 Tax=Heptranchias perlo TaxID=212740 RepID=UPI00355A0420